MAIKVGTGAISISNKLPMYVKAITLIAVLVVPTTILLSAVVNPIWYKFSEWGESYDMWSDGSWIYTCGSTDDIGGMEPRDLTLVRWDLYGNQIWASRWGSFPVEEVGTGVYGDSTGIYTCGRTPTGGFLVKWDSNGEEIWERWLNMPTSFNEMDVCAYGPAVYACEFGGSGGIYLAKWDSYGNSQWEVSWGVINSTRGGLWVDATGVYVGGATIDFGGSGFGEMVLAKFTHVGGFEWQKILAKSTSVEGCSMWGVGNAIYACGTGQGIIFLTKWDHSGNQVWESKLNLPGSANANDIWANEGFIYVTGAMSSVSNTGCSMVLATWAMDGNQLGYRTWDEPLGSTGTGVFGVGTSIFTVGNHYVYQVLFNWSPILIPNPAATILAIIALVISMVILIAKRNIITSIFRRHITKVSKHQATTNEVLYSRPAISANQIESRIEEPRDTCSICGQIAPASCNKGDRCVYCGNALGEIRKI